MNPRVAAAEQFLLNLNATHHSVLIILGDPWFSSLWTLQELIMRTDALILGKQGETVSRTKTGGRVFLCYIVADCLGVTRR